MKTEDITEEMIETGQVYIEIYPMVETTDGGRLILDRDETPDFYDVSLRPTGEVRADGSTDPFEEWENLTLEEAWLKVNELQALYPDICSDWIYE